MTKHKRVPSFSYKDVMSYEALSIGFRGCQSHLCPATVEAMQRDFERARELQHPSTPEFVAYMMNQDHELNPHEAHWLTTGLGKKWVMEVVG